MDYNAAALEMHAKYPGKLTVNSLFEVKDRDALSTAYTPGVAEPCRQIKANPDDVYKYTFKGRTVAVVTNGTAVLGLGDIGPEAGLPVMEGKCVLFKEFGGVDAFPICIEAHDVDSYCRCQGHRSGLWRHQSGGYLRAPSASRSSGTLEEKWISPCSTTTSTAPPSSPGWPHQRPEGGGQEDGGREDRHSAPGAAGTAIIKMLLDRRCQGYRRHVDRRRRPLPGPRRA